MKTLRYTKKTAVCFSIHPSKLIYPRCSSGQISGRWAYLFFVSLFLILLVIVFSQPAQAAAPYGNYLEMYGGYVKAGNSDQSNPSGFTFEAWVKPDSTGGIRPIFVVRNTIWGADDYNYWVGINGGSLAFNYDYNGTSRILVTAGNLPANTWSHIAATASLAHTRLYINGQQVFFNAANIASLTSIAPTFYLGTSYVSSDQPMAHIDSNFGSSLRNSFIDNSGSSNYIGLIDEVRVSRVALDIPSLWNNGTYNQRLTTNNDTVLLWHLDEGRGVENASDSSGNGRNGTLVGGDSQIRFYGVLPTPTPWSYSLPTLNWKRPVLPTLNLPQSTVYDPVVSLAPIIDSSYSFYSGDVRGFDRVGDRFSGR